MQSQTTRTQTTNTLNTIGKSSRFMTALMLMTLFGSAASAETDLDIVAAFVESNCVDCHSGDQAEQGLQLTAFVDDWRSDGDTRTSTAGTDTGRTDTAGTDIGRIKTWETVLLRIQSRQMPPPDNGQPDEAEFVAAEQAMVRVLDRYSQSHPYAGTCEPLRRMTRTEYKNAIRDLLSIDIDVNSILPPDSSSDGFDNITVAELSPLLIDRYLTAATRISRAAIGTSVDVPGGVTIRVPPDQSQEQHVEGLPYGTRGGTIVRHFFPRSGSYEIQVRLTRDRDEKVEGISGSHELDVLMDRKRQHRFLLKPVRGGNDHSKYDLDLNVRLEVQAGTHDIGVTFVEKSTPLLEIKREPFDASFNLHRHPRQHPAIHEVSIVGPFDQTSSVGSDQLGHRDTSDSRRRVFVQRPKKERHADASARQVFANLMRLAYRRRIEDADFDVPMRFFHQAFGAPNQISDEVGNPVSLQTRFDAGIEAGLTSILVNPNFLFRSIEQPEGIEPGTPYPIRPIELASGMSYFLWSSIPDEPLLAAAEDGSLADQTQIDEHTRRMLADPRSRSLLDNFADQWLYLRNLPTITPDLRLFPDFDNNLRDAFAEETKLLFADVIRRDASVLELISSDHTFLNERLAKHYEIPGVVGSHFRRVEMEPKWHRGGLLRHGSILTATSYATRTSPTIRGAWVLENILGTPPPPPPPNVPAIKEKTNAAPLSFRESLEQHRSVPACAGCHDLIDPVGFALDRYDAVGRWRSNVEGFPIDAKGRLPDGQDVDGVVELEQGILQRPELFVTALTEKLVTYALGRPITHRDGPAIRRIVRDAAKDNYRISDLISGITQSNLFLMRTSQ
ncbi:MAG: DUF1592 domain-containing protein [Planctomycetales bacterium]|nr:DUF1592 domain-containing protein [Planctomycetales bacterium]